MERKAGSARNIVNKSSQQLWPQNTEFKITGDYHFTGNTIVIPLPNNMFRNGSTTFGNLDTVNPQGINFSTVFELWLHILSTAKARMTADNLYSHQFRIQVLLEALKNTRGEVSEYRLWILEETADYNLNNIFNEAVESTTKKIDSKGIYVLPPDVVVTKNVMNTTDKVPYGPYDLYKRIDDVDKANVLKWMWSKYKKTSNEITDVYKVFSLAKAITYVGAEVQLSQKTVSTYQQTMGTYIFKNEYQFYKIPAFSWDICGTNGFMHKLFPHIQLNEEDTEWSTSIVNVGKKLDQKIAAVKTRNQATSFTRPPRDTKIRQSNLLNRACNLDGDAPPRSLSLSRSSTPSMAIEGEESPVMGNGRSETLPRPTPGPTIGGPTAGPAGGTRTVGVVRQGVNGVMIPQEAEPNTEKVDYEQIVEAQRSLGLRVEDESRTSEIDEADHILALQTEFVNHKLVLTTNYQVDKDREKDRLRHQVDIGHMTETAFVEEFEKIDKNLKDALNSGLIALCDISTGKYKRFCTSYSSETSDTMNKLYEYATGNDLFDMIRTGEADVIWTDTSLSAFDNWLKWLTHGFHQYERVTFHMSVCATMYIGLGNRFIRHKGLHIYYLLIGDAASGKTFLVDAVKKNVGPTTCMDYNSESRQAKAVDIILKDSLTYFDDSNLMKYAKSQDNLDGEQRALMTNNEIRRTVLEIDDDRVRRNKVYKYVLIGCTIDSSNIGEAELIKSTLPAQKAGMTALLSRYVIININSMKDELVSVQGSNNIGQMSAETLRQIKNFRDRNILLHILVAQYWHLTFIGCLPKPDMSVFDPIVQSLMEYLGTMGLQQTTNRQLPQIMLFCEQVVVIHSLLEMFFVRTGKFHMKPYDVMDLRHIIPVCRESDVFFAFTAYFPNFYPRELHPILTVIRKRHQDSIRTGDTEVEFKNPFGDYKDNNTSDDEDEVNEEKDNAQYVDGMSESSEVMQLRSMINKRPQEDNRQVQKKTRLNNASETKPAENHALNRKVSFVFFQKYTIETLVSDVHHSCSAEANRPSSTSVAHCLAMLSHWRIPTYIYKVRNDHSINPRRTHAPPIHRAGLIEHKEGIFVNYSILEDQNQFDNMCMDAIRYCCFKTTVPRRMLTMLPHEQHPWLVKAIELMPTNKPRIYVNSKYVPSQQQLILTGMDDEDQLEPDQRTPLMEMDIDIDSAALMQYFSTVPHIGTIGMEHIMLYHPQMILVRNKEAIMQEVRDGTAHAKFRLAKYPDAIIKEFEDARSALVSTKTSNYKSVDARMVGKHSELVKSKLLRPSLMERNAISSTLDAISRYTSVIPNIYPPGHHKANKVLHKSTLMLKAGDKHMVRNIYTTAIENINDLTIRMSGLTEDMMQSESGQALRTRKSLLDVVPKSSASHDLEMDVAAQENEIQPLEHNDESRIDDELLNMAMKDLDNMESVNKLGDIYTPKDYVASTDVRRRKTKQPPKTIIPIGIGDDD